MAHKQAEGWVSRRTLVTFSTEELIQLGKEAKAKGLKLATYLRSLIHTHPERASGAPK